MRTIVDRPFGSAAQSGLIDMLDHRTAARLAHNARMQHAVEHQIVHENRLAEHFAGEIDARRIVADNAIAVRIFGWRVASRWATEIDRARRAPSNRGRWARRDG